MAPIPADDLDLATAVIHNSWDVRAWPATAALARLEFRSTGVHVEHSKHLGADRWPDFTPPGWDGPLQYTIWIFLQIAGVWHGSGCIEYWQACVENGGPPEGFAENWYYAADRWGAMTGHQPAPGELVGFMVTAGDARNAGVQSVQERSQVVVLPFPSSGGVWVAPAVAEPPPPPHPVDDPPAAAPAIILILEQLARSVDLQTEAITNLAQVVATKDDLNRAKESLVSTATTLAGLLRLRLQKSPEQRGL